ncbi:MerR family transcriptional regulator [Paenibacillus sp. 2TAB23]|uniref:MerR family transcriptional regulator n=1 Tax=Paenibacillus sp. 2TAB23 TaxID=3233004 RepID=UPI003F9CF117
MEYTIQKLGLIAGISTRTLRYYDEIGMLKPARINSSGYRIYGQEEVNKLQQILFYKELGIGLEEIKRIVTAPSFDGKSALREHKQRLLEKRQQLDLLIANVDKTLAQHEGRITMTDQEKFEGFKQQLMDENEKLYGQEIREKYGDEQIERSNQIFKNMSEQQHAEIEQLGSQVISTLVEAYAAGDPASELAQKAADLHRQWLSFYWGHYSKEAHAGVAQMYVDDERFTAYYDKHQPGASQFLRDAVLIYTGMELGL